MNLTFSEEVFPFGTLLTVEMELSRCDVYVLPGCPDDPFAWGVSLFEITIVNNDATEVVSIINALAKQQDLVAQWRPGFSNWEIVVVFGEPRTSVWGALSCRRSALSATLRCGLNMNSTTAAETSRILKTWNDFESERGGTYLGQPAITGTGFLYRWFDGTDFHGPPRGDDWLDGP